MLLSDKTQATFSFETERLVVGLRTPQIVLDLTQEAWEKLGGQAGSLANRFSKGAKLYEIFNKTADAFDFEIFQPVTVAIEQAQRNETRNFVDHRGSETVPIVFCSRSVGH